MLKIQTYLSNNGLKDTVSKFKLNTKDLGHKVMFKYDQIRSPEQYIEVHESRGIVLSKDWQVISMPFQRFFSYNDVLSKKLNWNNTVVMEKRDGTLIQIYFDEIADKWCINTMFSEGEEDLYFNREPSGRSFKTLTLDLMQEYGSLFELFKKRHTYVFELTSQYNKVVIRYSKPELRLLAVRNLATLREYNFEEISDIAKEIKVPLVETHKLSSLDECLDSFKNMSFNFEGYVAWDGIDRVKIKNPAYVAIHLTKKREDEMLDLTKPYIFLDIVKQNEITEFKLCFPHAAKLIDSLHLKYNDVIGRLNKASEHIKTPRNITTEEKKLFATSVFTTLNQFKLDQSFSSIFFLLKDGKIESIEDYVNQIDNKKLYKILK